MSKVSLHVGAMAACLWGTHWAPNLPMRCPTRSWWQPSEMRAAFMECGT